MIIYDASLGSLAAGLGGSFYLSGDAVFTADNVTIASTTSGSLILPNYNNEISSGRCAGGVGKGCSRGVYRGGGIYASERVNLKLSNMNCFSLHAENSGACLYATGDVMLKYDVGVVNASVNTSRAISLVEMTEAITFTHIDFAGNTGSLYLYSVPPLSCSPSLSFSLAMFYFISIYVNI